MRKVENFLNVGEAQAKVVVAAAHTIEKDLFSKCLIAKAEAHAKELKEQDRIRRQEERAKKRGTARARQCVEETQT